jgi:hypothetical protein
VTSSLEFGLRFLMRMFLNVSKHWFSLFLFVDAEDSFIDELIEDQRKDYAEAQVSIDNLARGSKKKKKRVYPETDSDAGADVEYYIQALASEDMPTKVKEGILSYDEKHRNKVFCDFMDHLAGELHTDTATRDQMKNQIKAAPAKDQYSLLRNAVIQVMSTGTQLDYNEAVIRVDRMIAGYRFPGKV